MTKEGLVISKKSSTNFKKDSALIMKNSNNYRKKRNWGPWRKRRARLYQENLAKYGDYRDVLKAELIQRRAHSIHYSLRSFAKDLDISPSQLSRVLNGERGFSKTSAQKISRTLNLRSEANMRFMLKVQLLSARSIYKTQVAKQGLEKPALSRRIRQFTALGLNKSPTQ